MEQHRIPIIDEWVFYHELNAANARKAMYRLFAHAPYPEAIFAANDVTALTILECAIEFGRSVPGELKIVGYSNDPRTSIVSPSITTIEQFPEQIGTVIVAELLRILKGEKQEIAADTTPIVTPVQLIRRMST